MAKKLIKDRCTIIHERSCSDCKLTNICKYWHLLTIVEIRGRMLTVPHVSAKPQTLY
jgi:hypothetical protein